MNFSLYIANKILGKEASKKNMSRPIVKIGITGIALGVAVMIITMAVVTGFQQQITDKVVAFSAHIQLSDYNQNKSDEPNPIVFNEHVLNEITLLQNIKHIQSFATKNGIIKTKTDNQGIVLKGVSTDFDWSYLKPYIVSGSILSISKDSVSKGIFLSQLIANKLNVKLNQKLLVYFMTKKKLADTTMSGENFVEYEPRVKDFYVKGIFNTEFSDFDKNVAFIDLKQIQKLNYWNPNQVAGYEVYLSDFKLLDSSIEQLNDLIGYNYTATSVKQIQSSIFSWLDMIDINAIIIITLMVLVAAINMISALLILIIERTSMIGILKALGLANQKVRLVFFYVSVQLLFKGLLIGNIIGIGFCWLQDSFKLIALDPKTYYLQYVPVNLNLVNVLLINFGTIIICLLMMFLPTFILNKITPIKSIRFS